MKTIPFPTITAGVAFMLAAPAHAIEAPADDAPPPPMAKAAAPNQDARPAARAGTAYLGVVSSEIPAMLAEHIGVKPGEGIVMRAIMPGGPAAKAGIAVHDVITRLDDQPVRSAEDLSRQVKSRKPGETIRIDLIHQGKTAQADVVLGDRPDELAGIERPTLDQLNLDGIPDEFADRVRGMIQGNLGKLEMRFGQDGGLEGGPQLNEAMREMKQRMEEAMGGMAAPDNHRHGRIDLQQGATIRLLDEQGSIELKSNDGSKEVTIRDKDNNVTWAGPWDTAQDKAAAPDGVRQRVERLNLDTGFKGKGLRLQLRPGGALGDE